MFEEEKLFYESLKGTISIRQVNIAKMLHCSIRSLSTCQRESTPEQSLQIRNYSEWARWDSQLFSDEREGRMFAHTTRHVLDFPNNCRPEVKITK